MTDYPQYCPFCKSTDIGDYRNCAGNGLNWEGKEMFFCRGCNRGFTQDVKVEESTKVPQAQTPDTHSKKYKGKYYITNSGKQVWY